MGWQLDCRKDGGWTPTVSPGCLSEGRWTTAARKRAVFLECGSSCKFKVGKSVETSWSDEWGKIAAGRNGTLVGHGRCPVAPEHTVCSEEDAQPLESCLTQLSDSDWAA